MSIQRSTTKAFVAAIIGVSAVACHHSQSTQTATLPPEPVPAESQPHAAQTSGLCPMQVRGTQVAVNDTQDGVVIVFITPRENLAQLRERVHDMAARNEQMMGQDQGLGRSATGPVAPPMPEDKTGPIEPNDQDSGGTIGGRVGGARPSVPSGPTYTNPSGGPIYTNPSGGPTSSLSGGELQLVPSTIRVEDFDDGAQIVITPKDPMQLSSLRGQVRQRVSQMTGGYCPLMASL